MYLWKVTKYLLKVTMHLLKFTMHLINGIMHLLSFHAFTESRPVEIILIYNKSRLPEFNKLKVELLTLFKVLNKKINENNK